MSAFACILDRSGGALDPRALDRLAEPLVDYGAEVATFCRGPVGIAIRHRGGPGAHRRHGPLVDPESGTAVAVAGRFRALGGAPGADASDSPDGAGGAPLALARWGRRGALRGGDFLAGLCGSFTLLAADPGHGSIHLARDHLGDLKVYYFLDGRWLVAASEAAAVLRHPAVPDDLDEGSAARFLGFRFTHGDRSFFRHVRELPPAHRLHVTASETCVEPYWRFRPASSPSSGRRAPEAVTRELLDRLGRSIAAQTAGLEPAQVAVSLSGGLDSTAVAALAPRGIRAFSWYFEEAPEPDERRLVEAVSRHLDLPVRWVRGDGLHPLCTGFADRFVHPSSPYVNAFAALKCELYRTARVEGCERVLVGDGGDTLYAAREYWLRDLLAERRPGAPRSLGDTLRRAARGDRFARVTLARLLPVRGLRAKLRRRPQPWLTAAARAALPEESLSPSLPAGPRRVRYELAAGAKHSELESEERRLFARCGVERANPFWSWPLLEMAIHLPAYWSYRDGRTKVLAREALRGRLPEQVLESERVGLLGGFFLRGIELRRQELLETVFRRPRSDWPRYVRRAWLEPYLSATRSIAFGHTILWRVISYELWHRRLIGGG